MLVGIEEVRSELVRNLGSFRVRVKGFKAAGPASEVQGLGFRVKAEDRIGSNGLGLGFRRLGLGLQDMQAPIWFGTP